MKAMNLVTSAKLPLIIQVPSICFARESTKTIRHETFCRCFVNINTLDAIFLDHGVIDFFFAFTGFSIFLLFYVPLCEFPSWQRIKQFKRDKPRKKKKKRNKNRKIYAVRNHNSYYWWHVSATKLFSRIFRSSFIMAEFSVKFELLGRNLTPQKFWIIFLMIKVDVRKSFIFLINDLSLFSTYSIQWRADMVLGQGIKFGSYVLA